MTTAELAVLVSGAVGLGAPTISAAFQRSRDKDAVERDRETRDRDELRALLDETAAALHIRTEQLILLEQWMRASTLRLPKTDEHPEVEASTGPLLSTLEARLVIRRGRGDALVDAFTTYIELTDGALEEIDEGWARQEPFDFDDSQLEGRADRYRGAFEAFVDRAKETLG
jgi:hypothetical protein